MDEAWKTLAVVLGGGGTIAVAAILAIMFVVRGAIATAVQHAATRELAEQKGRIDLFLADRKAAFDREMQDKRDAFSLEQDRNRAEISRAANRELETFKASLSLAAEVRRQVAARRVQALDLLLAKAGAVSGAIGLHTDYVDDAEAREELREFLELVKAHSHFLSERVALKFHEALGLFGAWNAMIAEDPQPPSVVLEEAFSLSAGAFGGLVKIVRAELYADEQSP